MSGRSDNAPRSTAGADSRSKRYGWTCKRCGCAWADDRSRCTCGELRPETLRRPPPATYAELRRALELWRTEALAAGQRATWPPSWQGVANRISRLLGDD